MREFEMDASCSMPEALQVIRSALEDEGLALGPKSGSRDDVTSVISSPGRKTFMVPDTRIMEIGDYRRMQAVFAAQVARQDESGDER